jgi:APA family basic amino acid/polyamine antiporter
MGETDERPRALGAASLLALGINGIVGVGIFFTPNKIAGLAPGWSSVAVVGITGLALLPVAMAVSTIGARFSEDGGPVLYARAAFGELAGFVVGWLAYVAALFSMGSVMTGFMSAVLPFGALGAHLAAIALVTVLSLIAATGIKVSARVWNTLTVLKLLPLVGLAVLASVLLTAHSAAGHTEAETVTDWHAVQWGRAALTAVFVFQGFEIVPVLAGQARNPQRTIPIAVLGSLVLATVLYVLLQRGAVAGVPNLPASGAPLVAMGEAYGGHALARIVSIGTSVSAMGICFGMVATTPRFLSALVPRTRFGRVSKTGVPLPALVTTWAIVVALISLGSLGQLLALSSLSVVMQYLLVALALVKFAVRGERGLRLKDAWSAIPTVVVALVLVSGAEKGEWAVAAGSIVLSAVIYYAIRTRLA